jgi:hypothetical protein
MAGLLGWSVVTTSSEDDKSKWTASISWKLTVKINLNGHDRTEIHTFCSDGFAIGQGVLEGCRVLGNSKPFPQTRQTYCEFQWPSILATVGEKSVKVEYTARFGYGMVWFVDIVLLLLSAIS